MSAQHRVFDLVANWGSWSTYCRAGPPIMRAAGSAEGRFIALAGDVMVEDHQAAAGSPWPTTRRCGSSGQYRDRPAAPAPARQRVREVAAPGIGRAAVRGAEPAARPRRGAANDRGIPRRRARTAATGRDAHRTGGRPLPRPDGGPGRRKSDLVCNPGCTQTATGRRQSAVPCVTERTCRAAEQKFGRKHCERRGAAAGRIMLIQTYEPKRHPGVAGRLLVLSRRAGPEVPARRQLPRSPGRQRRRAKHHFRTPDPAPPALQRGESLRRRLTRREADGQGHIRSESTVRVGPGGRH